MSHQPTINKASETSEALSAWRECVRIELTRDGIAAPLTGFEDQGHHVFTETPHHCWIFYFLIGLCGLVSYLINKL